MDVHPLIFEPIFKPRIWGGRRLETVLGKSLPEGESIGESWELADLEEGQSVVALGPARGRTLGELVRDWGTDLLGRADLFEGRFPLLIKFLDARETLSVQVHPDEAAARRAGGTVRVKNEAWYVLADDEDGAIYRGLNEGVTREGLESALRDGSVESLMRRVPVKRGDCYYLPSGTVHALGAGTLVAEVQTPSDTTYRLYDWGRVDAATGQPRQLHIKEALECVSFGAPPPSQERSHVASVWTAVTRLVACDSFIIEKVRMVEGLEQEIPYAELVVWIVLEGRGKVAYGSGGESIPFGRGQVVLLPAALRDARVITEASCVWLEVTLPIPSDLAGYGRPDRDALQAPKEPADSPIQINVGGTGHKDDEE